MFTCVLMRILLISGPRMANSSRAYVHLLPMTICGGFVHRLSSSRFSARMKTTFEVVMDAGHATK